MNPDMMNQAALAATAPQGQQGPQAAPPPGPGIPPELMQLAEALGLDINNPEHLAILMQMIGGGGGGPMGPMAGAPPGEQGPPMPPQGPPKPGY
jgi:hypothetical protein